MGHASHHREHLLTRPAARVVVVLAALIFAGAVVHFAVTAYESRNCFTPSTDAVTGEPQRQQPIDSDDCRLVLSRSEDRQRTDATIAVLAIAVVIGAAVRLSKASRRTRRVVLVVEIIVLVLGAVYMILLASLLR